MAFAATTGVVVVATPVEAGSTGCTKEICLDQTDIVVREDVGLLRTTATVRSSDVEQTFLVRPVFFSPGPGIADAGDVGVEQLLSVPAGVGAVTIDFPIRQDLGDPELDELFVLSVLASDGVVAHDSSAVTIIDDDPFDQDVAFLRPAGGSTEVPATLTVNEGDGTVDVVVEHRGIVEAGGVDVTLVLDPDDTSDGTAFVLPSTTTFRLGFDEVATITIDLTDDELFRGPPSSYTLNLYALRRPSSTPLEPIEPQVAGVRRVPVDTFELVIEDNDEPSPPPPIELTFNREVSRFQEGSEGGGIIVTRDPSTDALELEVTVVDVTTSPDDYQVQPLLLVFEAGQADATLSISVDNDDFDEADEETFELSFLDGAFTHTVAIIDNDEPPPPPPPAGGIPSFSVGDVRIEEADGVANVVVTRTGSLTTAVTIPVLAIDGTARATSDYRATDVPAGIGFAADVSQVVIPIGIVRNLRYEGTEAFRLELGTPSFGTLTDGDATITIDDTADTPVPRLVPGPSTFVDEDVGAVSFSLFVPRAPEIDMAFFVETFDGFAEAGTDYEAFSGFVTIPAGRSTSRSFQILIIDDSEAIDGAEEIFAVAVRPFDDEVAIAATTIVTIRQDDRLPRARFVRPLDQDPSESLGIVLTERGDQPATTELTVVLDDPSPTDPYTVAVQVLPIDLADVDRLDDDVATPIEVSFPPGVTQQTISLSVAPNSVPGDGITFALALVDETRIGLTGAPDDGALVTVLDDDQAPEPAVVGGELRTGIGDWFDGLLGGVGAIDLDLEPGFDLGNVDWPSLGLPEVDPPVIPSDLGALFGLDDLFAGLATPTFDVNTDTLDEIVADMDAAGCPVDFAAGGAGGAPAAAAFGDIIQVRCTRTLADILEASGYSGDDLNGDTPDVLEGLAAALNLDADIDWRAGGVVELVAGVDLEGFYVLGSSGAQLRVQGNGTVTGDGTVADVQNTTIDGTADADITVGVRLARNPDRRVRTAQLERLTPQRLIRTLDGDATMALTATVDDTTLDWDATWTATPDATGATRVTTTQQLVLRIDLPGFAVGDTGATTSIELTGVLADRTGAVGWNITGTAVPAEGLELDGFTVTRLAASGFVSGAVYDVTIDVGLLVGDGPDAVAVDGSLRLTNGGWTLTASTAIDQVTFGPIRLTDLTVDVDASYREPSDLTTFRAALPGGTTNVSVSVSAAAGQLLGADGEPIATMDGLVGDIESSGAVRVVADRAVADIGGVLRVVLTDVAVGSPDADGVIVSVGVARATATQLGDLAVTITDLQILADGRFSARSATVDQPDGIVQSIGLAGLVPVDVTSLTLAFTNVDDDGRVVDLTEFEIAVEGTVDMSGFAGLPFVPVLQIGGDLITPASPFAERAIAFSARVESVDPLVVTPLDLGPITLGLQDLEIGDVVLDASINADGFENGVLLPQLGGSASITGGFSGITGTFAADIDGSFVDGPTGVEIEATAVVGFSASNRNGATIEDLSATLDLRLGIDGGAPFIDAALTEVSVGAIEVPFGDIATIRLEDASFDFTATGNEVAFLIDGDLAVDASGASLVFDTGIEALDGWGGRIGNVGISADFGLVFQDGFFVDVSVPDGEQFGLPDFIPLRVDEIGLQLPEAIAPGDSLDTVLSQIRFSFSGGLSGTDDFPITATVDDLVVDIARLLAFDPLAPLDLATFPISNIDGVSFAIDPAVDLGVARVSGGLTFGTTEVEGTDVFYARIGGLLSTPAFDAGADIVVSQYGPVLLKVTAPLGIPLGPTGFVLTSVTGAAAFGDVRIDPPRNGRPEDLLTELADLPTDVDVDPAAIAEAVGTAVARGVATWDTGFALALEGQLTHVTAAGLVSGGVTILTSVTPGRGAQLIGRGDVEIFGIPIGGGVSLSGSVATGGFLIDLTDPIAPRFDFAFESPTPGSPLAVVFPVRTTLAGQLRTDGVVEGVAAGLDAFIDEFGTAGLAGIAARLEGDRGNPLAQIALDADGDLAVSDIERAQTITGVLLSARLLALLDDPAGAARVVGPLISALSTEIGSLSSADAEDLAADFFDVVGDAGAAALGAADANFNPSVTLRGALQPLILGFPLGDPDTSFEVIIDRDSLGFTLTTSIIENLKSQAGFYTSGLAEPLITAFTLGARDDVTVGVQLPLPGLSDVLLSGGSFPSLSTDDPNWSVTLAGAFSQFGMRAEVTGFITSAGNNAFVDARIERRYLADGTEPPDQDRIQFTRQQDYDNLLRYGGLVLDGRLEVPRLLTDPVGVIEDLPPIPEELVDSIAWFDEFGAEITQTDTPIRLTAFVPGLGEVIDDPSDAALEEWAAAISVTGVFEGTRRNPGEPAVARLLSLPIGEGRLLATSSGIEVTADIPLLGAEGTFALRVDQRNGVKVPVGGVEVSMSTAALQNTLQGLGVPPVFSVAGVDASAGFRAFTPGFEPGSSDPLRRTGGVAVRARVDAEGFVDEALLDVSIDPVGTGSGPDFRAAASVAQVGPFGGVAVTDAAFTIEKLGPAVTIDLQGNASVAGSTWTVDGTLNPDLTGQLVLLGSGGSLPEFSGFRFVDGGLALTISRTAGRLGGSVGIAGRVALPAWLAGRSSSSTVAAAGCIGTNGSAEFRLSLGRINLDPAGNAALVGSGQPLAIDPNAACALPSNAGGLSNNDARIVVRVKNSTTTVAIDGAVTIAGSGLPLLNASGALSTAGTGTLTVNFDSSGLDLGGFRVRGESTLSLRSTNQFDLTVAGRVTIPGLVTDARVSGAITNSGIQQLSIATTGLTLPGVTVNSARLDLLRSGASYRVDAALRIAVTGVRRAGTTTTTLDVAGSVLPTGNFSLAVTGSGFTVVGVALDGSLTFAKSGSTLSFGADTTFGLWGSTFDADGSLTIATNGISGNLTISSPGGLRFGNFALGGTLRLQFSAGTTNTVSISLQNGTVTIPGLGTFNATASLSTTGSGSISVSTPSGVRVGGTSSPLFLVGGFRLAFDGLAVSFSATNVGLEYRSGGTVVFRSVVPSFSVSSTELLPIIRDIPLPDLDVGTFFEADRATFRLTIEATSARFELREISNNDPLVSVFGGTANMRLRSLLITSGGTFQGRVDGSLSLFGKPITSGDYDISLTNGLLRLAIPTARAATIDLGFLRVRVSGFVQSDGRFDMSGSASTRGSIPGASWSGTATMRVRDAGISGSYSGNVSVLGLSADSSGSIDETGQVSGTVRTDLNFDGRTTGFNVCVIVCAFVSESAAFSFNLSGDDSGAPPDTTRPAMAAPLDVRINTSQASGSIPVSYAPPTATDNRDGTLFPRCTPGTDSNFAVGQTTTVSCTASDAAGNTRTVTFTVTVRFVQPRLSVVGNTVIASLGGFKPRSTTLLVVRSEPRVLGEVIVDDDGVGSYRVVVPSDLPPGLHSIVVSGLTADGAEISWVVPIVVDAAGVLTEVTVGDANAVAVPALPTLPSTPAAPSAPAPTGVGTPSAGPLPATGSSPANTLTLALAAAFLGLVLWGGTRRRGVDRTQVVRV